YADRVGVLTYPRVMAAGPAEVRRPFMPLIFMHRKSNLDPAEWAESIWRSEAAAFVLSSPKLSAG
ncbi:hypothetical protein P4H83_28075, partial [Paenibacillus favisporus]|uniref:hypothetical protein n=1 Tax=Paenibacillus favisporus TaxID=221028 RepID=UPI002DB8C30E